MKNRWIGHLIALIINLAVTIILGSMVRDSVVGRFGLNFKDAEFVVMLCMLFYLLGLLAMWLMITIEKRFKKNVQD